MKKLNGLDKALFFVNTLLATTLLLGYLLPFISAESFPQLSVLSLAFPILVLVNVGFLLFWLLRFKRQWLLSFLVLLIGYAQVKEIYAFGSETNLVENGALSVMSYNVRLFNLYDWIKDEDVRKKIATLAKEEDPDILCMQEFLVEAASDYAQFPFRYIQPRSKNNKTGLVIFSKYRIIDRGSLDFPSSNNNAIFVDVVKAGDTLRIYNLHLESLRIDTKTEELTQENSGRLLKRISTAFVKQESQAKIFQQHQTTHDHPQIVCGDLNNTGFSHVYKMVKGDMRDAFLEVGSGFGKTFNYRSLPIRIDFVFSSGDIRPLQVKNFKENLSDHYPVKVTFNLQ